MTLPVVYTPPSAFSLLSRFSRRSDPLGFVGLALLSLLLPRAARGQSAAFDPPAGYYASATNKSGAALESSLHAIIAKHTVLSYTPGVWDALEVLDADPVDPANRVILIYSDFSALIANEYHGGTTTGTWDREHLWCQSFFADDAKIKTDAFNVRPVDYAVNDVRSNRFYDTVPAPASTLAAAPGSRYNTSAWEPRDSDKGAIARAVFYMAVCYDGTAGGVSTTKLTLSDTPNLSTNTFGKLSTLLAWNRQYPVTEAERRRNQLVYGSYQRNRNPFVDDRYLADLVFGGALTPQEAWLRTKFSAAELAAPTISGDQADPDGDGLNNLLEYAFSLDPKMPSATAQPAGGLTIRGNTVYLTLTHLVNRQASNLSWRYQSSTDLHVWAEVTPTLLSNTHLDADATDLVTVGVPATSVRQFLRVVVSKP